MSTAFDMQERCPSMMHIHRAGTGIVAAPDDIASGSFLVQMLLSSRTEGEMTAMRAFVPPGVVTHWHGESPACPFSYLSVQPVKNGTAVAWFGPVNQKGFQQ
ncbi:UNVERIFIED_ORG: hypothetical protein BCL66_11355 [Martelella mediterranea]